MAKLNEIKAVIFDWVGTLYQFGGHGLFPISEKVLQELKKKYKLAVISRDVTSDIETRSRQINNVGHYFDFIVVDKIKTPEQFTECMQRLGVKPEDTLVVDDRVDRGIQIANNLGCKTAWVQKGIFADIRPSNETGQPTYKINSVGDLLKIL